ncbi:MAG: phosphate ABC transporter permease PstA [Anaerolineae bacterium]|nr:phosphate ABC transporter permease PstA [Anaerolineae bacterium]
MKNNIASRNRTAKIGQSVMFGSTLFALVALVALLLNVVNRSFGNVIVRREMEASAFSPTPLDQLSRDDLAALVKRIADSDDYEGLTRGAYRRMDLEKPFAERSKDDIIGIINERLIKEEVVTSFTMWQTVFDQAGMNAELAKLNKSLKVGSPEGRIEFRSWINSRFFTQTMGSVAENSGIRVAILGSLAVIALTMLLALPIGIGAAIYLEEYAVKSRLNDLIQTNITNLAGVPSIIYGMLGLFVFVRALESFTSGAMFGITDSNGRTVLSAGLTMSLLVLPIIIINAQEAIRAVPNSLRQASYGIGATKWETIRDHIMPAALPGIMTGTILAMSRAMGETAPMVVIGASTFIVSDPTGPFSKFTTLPIQIYTWTAQPDEQFRNIAAAAILVLLVTLLSLNMIAILLRNRFSK